MKKSNQWSQKKFYFVNQPNKRKIEFQKQKKLAKKEFDFFADAQAALYQFFQMCAKYHLVFLPQSKAPGFLCKIPGLFRQPLCAAAEKLAASVAAQANKRLQLPL